MNVKFDFSDRHAMVFGGTTGINFGIAQGFAAAGAKVSVASRKQANVDAAVAALGGTAFGATTDVRDDESVAAALAQAAARHGPIDVLVSGAAGNFLAEVNAMSSNAFKVVVDIDLIGSFHVARQAWPHLRKPGASVVFITAPQGVVPTAHLCNCSLAARRKGCAGLPKTVVPAATLRVTTAPMPMTAPLPMTMGRFGLPCFRMAPVPI